MSELVDQSAGGRTVVCGICKFFENGDCERVKQLRTQVSPDFTSLHRDAQYRISHNLRPSLAQSHPRGSNDAMYRDVLLCGARKVSRGKLSDQLALAQQLCNGYREGSVRRTKFKPNPEV